MVIDIPNLQTNKVRHLVVAPVGYALNRRMFDGDHWLDGNGYIGPKPGPGEVGGMRAMQIIKDGFVSRNVIKEVVGRRRGGAADAPPIWRFAPSRALPVTAEGEVPEGESRALNELHADLIWWFKRKRVHQAIKDGVEHMLLGQRCVLRLYIPPGRLSEVPASRGGEPTAEVRAASLREALDHIYVDALPPDRAEVLTDDNTKAQIGVYAADNNVTEVTYLDGDSTVLMTLDRGVDRGVYLNLGRRLTMHQMNCKPFITQQVREMQMAYNFSLSTMPRTIASAAFLERILTNAQLPGEFEIGPGGKATGRFIPKPFQVGAGTTQFIQGITYKDSDGKTNLADPGVHFRQPAEVRPIVDAKRSMYNDILEECGQAHVLLNASELPSGTSRDQARADFKQGLEDLAGEMNDAGVWLMETVLAFAEYLTNQPGFYTNRFHCEFIARINTGPLSTEEQQNTMLAVEKKLMSPETAMDRLQIPETDAEQRRINNDPLTRVKVIKEQLEALEIAFRANLDPAVVAEAIGMDPEMVKKLVLPPVPPPTEEDNDNVPPIDGGE
jgi:hypothetical protein